MVALPLLNPLLVLLPLVIGLAAVALLKVRMKSGYIAAMASFVGLALLFLVQQGTQTINWFSAGSFAFPLTVTIAPLNFILLGIVFFVGGIIYLYSTSFMDTLSEQKRFYAEMLGFQLSMAVFAMSGNFIILFIAWEFLSLFSYLLIGFWHRRESADRAARLAITTVLIGDLALLASIVILWNVFGTFDFAAILSAIPSHISLTLYGAVALLVLAIFTKSAQFPFQEWLPEAMEGPTPVSAFLHSTTMVKAGVFVAIILFPLISAAGLLRIMLVFGIITAAIATLNAAKETQIKRVIAYSTVQELSLMLVAIGSGAIIAAIYFFIVQSFYKALLFFVSGAVMKATKEDQLERTSGLNANGLLYLSALFGVLSVAGIIPFSGFFAAAGIGNSLLSNIAVYAIVSVIGLGTSFFIFRWFFLVSKPDKSARSLLRYKALPKPMIYTTLALAVLALTGSAIFFYITGFLGGSSLYLKSSSPLSVGILDILDVTLLAAVGALISYLLYKSAASGRAVKRRGGALNSIAYSHRIFIFLNNASARFLYEVSDGVAAFDAYLNEALDFFGHGTVVLSNGLRRISVGGINAYALIFAIALLVVLVYAYLVII